MGGSVRCCVKNMKRSNNLEASRSQSWKTSQISCKKWSNVKKMRVRILSEAITLKRARTHLRDLKRHTHHVYTFVSKKKKIVTFLI